jgi:nucleoid DNA-binding protein
MIKSQFNRYVLDALAKRQRKSNIDEANAVIDVSVEAIKEALSENSENNEILLVGFGRFIKSKVEAKNGINPKSSKTNFNSHTEAKIFFMYDWLLTSIYPLKKHLKTCF